MSLTEGLLVSSRVAFSRELTIACSILLSMATTLAPDELQEKSIWSAHVRTRPSATPVRGSCTKPPGVSGKPTVSLYGRPRVCVRGRGEHPVRGTEVTLQAAGDKRWGGAWGSANAPPSFIYLLSSLRRELSALRSDDRKEMEKFRS